MAKGNSQNLTPRALKRKRKRDLAAANTREREIRRAENQRIGQNSNSDLHHAKDGSIIRVPTAWNRDTHGRGEVGKVGRKKKRGRKKRAIA